MERLNLRTPKSFEFLEAAGTVSPRIRFYCVSEGATEESYFYGIKNSRNELQIKNDVHIEVIEKQEGQENFSHPMQLVNACLYQMGHIDSEGNEIPQDQWAENCKWENYDAKLDQVCVIFDRDYRNFEEVLEEIFELCDKHGIKVVLSNPNFELWLLMHFPNIKQYPAQMLLENRKNLRHQLFEDASTQKKYLEILVSRNAEGYTKGHSINFEKFLPLVNNAVQQASFYCEEPRQLTDELGTSVGRLIEEMRTS